MARPFLVGFVGPALLGAAVVSVYTGRAAEALVVGGMLCFLGAMIRWGAPS